MPLILVTVVFLSDWLWIIYEYQEYSKMKNNVMRVLPALVMAGIFAAPASADFDKRTYFVPAISYVGADEDRGVDGDDIEGGNVGLQLGFGKALNDRWNLEF